MYCPKCGYENENGANFCVQCGYSFSDEKNPTQTINEKRKITLKFIIFLVLFLFVFYIFMFSLLLFVMGTVEKMTSMAVCGLIFTVLTAIAEFFIFKKIYANRPEKFANSKLNKKVNNKWGIAIAVALSLFLSFAILAGTLSGEETPSDESGTIPTTEETTTKKIDKVVSLIIENCGVSEEEAEIIKADFKSVGIDNLKYFDEFEGAQVEGMKSFKFSSEKVSGTFIIRDGKTDYIASGDIILFDDEKGGAIDDISRYYLSEDEKNTYLYSAEEIVKQNLKSPSTADFPNWYGGNWSVTRKDNVVTVKSYVDAQNSFGTMLRSKFAVQYDYTTGALLYFNFDGEVMYGTAQK